MQLSPTLSLYLGRQFLIGFGTVIAGLAVLVYTVDAVELLRRAGARPDVSVGAVMGMAGLKLPIMVQKLLPFATLFGAMFAFVRLTRSSELVVVRAAGVSVWQFLFPALAAGMGIGLLTLVAFNPIAAATAANYEKLEAKYLRGRASLLAVSSNGLWLRQADPDGQSVIHALRVSQQGVELEDVIIFLYQGGDRFVGRIDAKSARLEPGYWLLSDALITGPDRPPLRRAVHRVDTTLTLAQIQESFASPHTLSFWALPGFIATLEKAGFSGLRHRLHWHTMLALPLLLAAMVLLAAAFSLRMTRRGGTGLLVGAGALVGFIFYFLGDVVLALGQSGGLPAFLAAWAPTGIGLMLGIAALLHLEDG
ncbi:MAG: LPS export ABC transporter permease LptG [Alphaproteobacteria bacterium]|nr:LPS export ABC transporter permease LptG [Alphaproteobacteria bacterium]